MSEISLLLGAGFSKNFGYPTGNELNQYILNLKTNDFAIADDGSLTFLREDEEDPFWYLSKTQLKDLFIGWVSFYHERYGFDYEEFYDHCLRIHQSFNNGEPVEEFQEFYKSVERKRSLEYPIDQVPFQTIFLLNQIVSSFITDAQDRKYYEPVHVGKPYYPGYTGFLNCVEAWGNRNEIVHVHTLNHDLLFETFNDTDWLNIELSDGFQELGTPYFGIFRDKYKYNVKLPFFTDLYDSKFRLYKLHGSLDYIPFHKPEGNGIDAYVKIKPRVKLTELYKEFWNETEGWTYYSDWINYHSDFLTGKDSKKLRYREPVYYESVFKHFENNLENSHTLVIVGYGCRDEEINNLIKRHFLTEGREIFIVNPTPDEAVEQLCEDFRAKTIQKDPENLEIEDFQQIIY